ncbi:cation diffusion facilitator family transporter [Hyphomicrobium sp. MC1]|uniref:cation diffusion facilitator family transporter n=1 Tax=Hyphomicrobium sp. (strain MC1) TaxID=717785 RepID=UPI000213F8AF|nr:cation diffusion facilitator family transporter [Hyphomicrobium sp. MC1]CCB63521.1 Cation diffusion facilitator family transporter [Hyphomicrobium sp. MC1]
MSETALSKRVVYAALIGNLLVAATKFVAAAATGSSSMLSEAVHSLVDTGNEALLLYGYFRSSRRPDDTHPLGYGRELYFWSFIVSLLLFAIGAGVSIYEGIDHIIEPNPITNPGVNYIVLAMSAVFEGTSWWIALKRFGKLKGRRGYWETVRDSKDPPSFMVLFEDTAALIGIAIAAAGNFAAQHWDISWVDGAASILIGIVLAIAATVLARENKALLIGERASDEVISSILSLAISEQSVDGANNVFALHLAPDQILVALSLEFSDELRTPQIEAAVVRLEERIRAKHPEVISLFIKPQTRRTFEKMRAEFYGDSEETG